MTRFTLTIASVLLLAACGHARSAHDQCHRSADTGLAFDSVPSVSVRGDTGQEVRLVLTGGDVSAGIEAAVAQRYKAKPSSDPFRILALSTGGAYGAYGTGILAELFHQDRPKPSERNWRFFDVVTGSSTGSMLAPLVYLGRAEDMDTLVEQYSTLSNDMVFAERSPLTYLWADSLYDTAPLRGLLDKIVTVNLLQAIAQEWRTTGRVLAVVAVNADTGRVEIFDLGRLAATATSGQEEVVRDRFVRALMASAAIPIAFPPVFYDGCMMLDGGVRQHLFATSEAAFAIAKTDASGWNHRLDADPRTGRRVVVISRSGKPSQRETELYLLVNNDLRVSTMQVRPGLLTIAQRTFTMIVDQGMRAEINRMAALSATLGWKTRYTDAYAFTRFDSEPDEPPLMIGGKREERAVIASDNDDLFDPKFTRRLYELGRAWGQAHGQCLWQHETPDYPNPAFERDRSCPGP